MVSGLDLARAPRRARLTARKKGSGYENESVPAIDILVPRASRPHASSLGPGTHRTGTARKLALISNAHGN